MIILKTRWLMTAAMAAAMPAMALAQQTAADADDGEIVVTAQKRTERLLDTPQSVTAIGTEELTRMGAVQFRDFANSVPALSFTTAGAGQSQLTLRGVTTGNDIGQTVGIYVDEVPYGSSGAFTNSSFLTLDAGLFDIDRIEVLRGPQGTIYGASTMGGLIKYVTAKPDLDQLRGAAQLGLSDTRSGSLSYNGAASVSVPVAAGKAAVRASGYYSRDGGYIDNVALGDDDVNASDIYGGRLDLLLQPSEALTLRFTGFAQNIDRDGTAAADLNFAGAPIDGRLEQRRLLAEPFEQKVRLASGTADYDFGTTTLTSVSSYQTMTTDFRQDASAVYVPLLALAAGLNFNAVVVDQGRRVEKFTQEVRLASNGGETFEWLVGGFFTDEDNGNTQLIVPFNAAGAVVPINLATIAIPSTYREIAGFGNLTWHLTERFDVSGGVRYADNRQKFEQIGSGALIGSTPEKIAKDDVVTYLANARYRVGEDATAYVRYATGYRPGGPNFSINDPVTGLPLLDPTYKSDTLDSYEVGFKAETSDRSFGIDISAYHIDWRDIQVSVARPGASGIGNAGKARIDGGELTLTARPTPALTARGAFAFQNARLAEDAPDLGAVDGDRLPNVPRYSATLDLDYRTPGEDGLRPSSGATLRFVSDRVSSFDASAGFPQYQLPGYVAVDLRTGLTVGRVEAQLFVRNLFDTRGQLSAATTLSSFGGPAQVTIMQPRTIGISATTRF